MRHEFPVHVPFTFLIKIAALRTLRSEKKKRLKCQSNCWIYNEFNGFYSANLLKTFSINTPIIGKQQLLNASHN